MAKTKRSNLPLPSQCYRVYDAERIFCSAGEAELDTEQTQADRNARLDAEQREADRIARRGCDFDPAAQATPTISRHIPRPTP